MLKLVYIVQYLFSSLWLILKVILFEYIQYSNIFHIQIWFICIFKKWSFIGGSSPQSIPQIRVVSKLAHNSETPCSWSWTPYIYLSFLSPSLSLLLLFSLSLHSHARKFSVGGIDNIYRSYMLG